jgi:hypothetical protein
MRKELIKNIVKLRPIPAIFLYKDEAGSKYDFNILDGKQRLESIMMFIGNASKEFKIDTWPKYIHDSMYREDVGFSVHLGDGEKPVKFSDLDPGLVRDLREYPIPVIEIQLNENTSLDEMIDLFIDINQGGVKVNRLTIVKALKNREPLLKDTYAMIAVREVKQQDVLEKKKKNPFADVLKRLQVVASVADPSAQADRMWEKLLELSLFVRSGGQHRKPAEILKTFIKTKGDTLPRLSKEERRALTVAFTFLRKAYTTTRLKTTRLATDQTHFYIMVTALLDSDLLTTIDQKDLINRLLEFANLIEGKSALPRGGPLRSAIRTYLALSTEKTTDVSRRKERQTKFVQAIKLLGNADSATSEHGHEVASESQ